MSDWRPTTLRLSSDHCPGAVDFYAANAPTDRRQFECGTAAHMMLEALAKAANAKGSGLVRADLPSILEAAIERILSSGRTFENIGEPPLSIDPTLEARGLVERWIDLQAPADEPGRSSEIVVHPGALIEVGFAVDEQWRPVTYSADAHCRLIVDWLEVLQEDGEETTARILTITDYKSSWPTDAAELETVQRKAQAVLGWLHYPDVDAIRLRVVNLRTCRVYEREIWYAAEADVLERWRRELDIAIRSLESRRVDGRLPRQPGGGCIGCPYRSRCAEGSAFVADLAECDGVEQRIRAFIAAKARVEDLGAILKEELGDAVLDLGDGWRFGRMAKDGREPVDGAGLLLYRDWLGRGGDAESFAAALDLGVSGVEAVAKRIYPDRSQAKDRRAYIDELMRPAVDSRFGLHRVQEGE